MASPSLRPARNSGRGIKQLLAAGGSIPIGFSAVSDVSSQRKRPRSEQHTTLIKDQDQDQDQDQDRENFEDKISISNTKHVHKKCTSKRPKIGSKKSSQEDKNKKKEEIKEEKVSTRAVYIINELKQLNKLLDLLSKPTLIKLKQPQSDISFMVRQSIKRKIFNNIDICNCHNSFETLLDKEDDDIDKTERKSLFSSSSPCSSCASCAPCAMSHLSCPSSPSSSSSNNIDSKYITSSSIKQDKDLQNLNLLLTREEIERVKEAIIHLPICISMREISIAERKQQKEKEKEKKKKKNKEIDKQKNMIPINGSWFGSRKLKKKSGSPCHEIPSVTCLEVGKPLWKKPTATSKIKNTIRFKRRAELSNYQFINVIEVCGWWEVARTVVIIVNLRNQTTHKRVKIIVPWTEAVTHIDNKTKWPERLRLKLRNYEVILWACMPPTLEFIHLFPRGSKI